MTVTQQTLVRLRRALPLLLVVCALIYGTGAGFHSQRVNTQIEKADQGAYIAYARQMSLTRYEVVGGRNQMPVFPFLISLIDRHGVTTDELFERAKAMNIVLSMLVLVGVYLLLRATIPRFESYVMTLIVGFTVYVYRAGYAQAELLFYGLFFLCFLLALRLIREPSWRTAGMLGLVLGVSYLTKAAVLPLLAATLFWGTVAVVAKMREGEVAAQSVRRVAVNVVVVIVFLVTIYPYISTSKERFGHWFYNVNTTFYMWADTWDEVKQTMSGAGDREHWPDLPEHLIPSPTRYFSQHSAGDVAARLANGFWTSELRHLIYMPFGYGKYLIFYALVAVAVAIRAREKVVAKILSDGRWLQAGFALTVIAGYLVAYAFYSPIVRGPRLALVLYIPAMFSIFWLLTRPGIAKMTLFRFGGRDVGLLHVHGLSLAVLATDLAFRLPSVIVTSFAGA